MAVAQSLAPYLALAMAPIGVAAALAGRRTTMALTASAVGIGSLVLARPVVFPPALRAVAGGASTGLRIASLNLLYTNDEANIGAAADDLRGRDLDVIVFVEYTAGHERALRDSELADDFPCRIERSGPGASGIAIWSKSPAEAGDRGDTTDRTLDVTVRSALGPVRVLAVHAHTPTDDFETWKHDLDQFRVLGRTGDEPTVVIGDFNASFWHPSFRALLDDGFTDAHIAFGSRVLGELAGRRVVSAVHPPRPRADDRVAGADRRRGLRHRRQRSPRADRHRRASSVSSARNARPRCESSFFASGPISANVRPSPSSGTKIAS